MLPIMLSLSLIWLPRKMQGDDGDDGDKCKDQGVFREALALFVDDRKRSMSASKRVNEAMWHTSFP